MTSTKIFLTLFSLLTLLGSPVSGQSGMLSLDYLQQVLEFFDLASAVWPHLRTIPIDGLLRQPVVCPTAIIINAQWSVLPNPQRDCIPRLLCDGSQTLASYIPRSLHSFVHVNFDQCSRGTLIQAFLEGFKSNSNCAGKFRTCSYEEFFSWPVAAPALETSTATPTTSTTTTATPVTTNTTSELPRSPSASRPSKPVDPSENPVVSRVRGRLEAMITPATFANLGPASRNTLLNPRSSNVAFLSALNSVLSTRLHTLRNTVGLVV